MLAPLLDSRGNLRYYIGAQVDVSGLVKDCTDLDAFKHYVDVNEGRAEADPTKDEFQELSEMFNISELDIVKKHGGNMHREHVREDDGMSVRGGHGGRGGPRVLIKDMSDFETAAAPNMRAEGRLQGVYKHVGLHCLGQLRLLMFGLVSTDPASTFATYPIRLALPPRSWNSAITVLGPDRREHTCARLRRRRADGFFARCHGKGSVAQHPSVEPRRRAQRRGTASMDPLHTLAGSIWYGGCVDGGPCR